MGCPYHTPPIEPKDWLISICLITISIFLICFLFNFRFITDSFFLSILAFIISLYIPLFLFFKLPLIIKDFIDNFPIITYISEEDKKQALNVEQQRKKWVKNLRVKWEKDMTTIKYWSDMPRKIRDRRTENLLKEAEKYYIALGKEKAYFKWKDYPEHEANMNHLAK